MKSPRTYNCPKCPKTFPWPRNVRKHVESMHSKRHKCPEANCDEAFDTQHDLRRHSSVEHPKFRTCEYCPYKHRKPAMVRRHREQFHGDNAVSCSVEGCGMIMPYRKIKSHVQEKHSDVLYPLKATTSTTPEVMLFECPKCQKNKSTRSQLRRHIANVHEKRYAPKKETGKSYACPEEGCDYSFRTPGDLDDHLNTQVHKSEYPFECGHCSKKFSQRSLYAIHLRKYHAISIKTVMKALGNFHSQVCETEKEYDDDSQNGKQQQKSVNIFAFEGKQENVIFS